MNIDQICPELLDLHASGEIKNKNGNVVTMDTTGLAKNYYLDDEDSDDDQKNFMYGANLGTKQEIDKFNYSMDQKTKAAKYLRYGNT